MRSTWLRTALIKEVLVELTCLQRMSATFSALTAGAALPNAFRTYVATPATSSSVSFHPKAGIACGVG